MFGSKNEKGDFDYSILFKFFVMLVLFYVFLLLHNQLATSYLIPELTNVAYGTLQTFIISAVPLIVLALLVLSMIDSSRNKKDS